MSVREKQQMNLDAESAAHTRMEHNSRSSYKYLILQVWCGVLTVAMVVMAAFVASIMPKSTEDEVSIVRPDASPTAITVDHQPYKSPRSSTSYIHLIAQGTSPWVEEERCASSCSLALQSDSISCDGDGIYFIYAQVTFIKRPDSRETKSVFLQRKPSNGKSMKVLVEGTFPPTLETVFVAKIVKLQRGDSFTLNITHDYRKGHRETFWGAYQLQ